MPNQDNKAQLRVEFAERMIKEIIPPSHLPPRGHGLFNPQGERYPSSGIIQWLVEHINIGADGGMSIAANLLTRYLKTTDDLLIPPKFSRTGQAIRIRGTGENVHVPDIETKVAPTKTTPDSPTAPSLKKVQLNNKERPFLFPPIPTNLREVQKLIKEYELYAQNKRPSKILFSIPSPEQSEQYLKILYEREFAFSCALLTLEQIQQSLTQSGEKKEYEERILQQRLAALQEVLFRIQRNKNRTKQTALMLYNEQKTKIKRINKNRQLDLLFAEQELELMRHYAGDLIYGRRKFLKRATITTTGTIIVGGAIATTVNHLQKDRPIGKTDSPAISFRQSVKPHSLPEISEDPIRKSDVESPLPENRGDEKMDIEGYDLEKFAINIEDILKTSKGEWKIFIKELSGSVLYEKK